MITRVSAYNSATRQMISSKQTNKQHKELSFKAGQATLGDGAGKLFPPVVALIEQALEKRTLEPIKHLIGTITEDAATASEAIVVNLKKQENCSIINLLVEKGEIETAHKMVSTVAQKGDLRNLFFALAKEDLLYTLISGGHSNILDTAFNGLITRRESKNSKDLVSLTKEMFDVSYNSGLLEGVKLVYKKVQAEAKTPYAYFYNPEMAERLRKIEGFIQKAEYDQQLASIGALFDFADVAQGKEPALNIDRLMFHKK